MKEHCERGTCQDDGTRIAVPQPRATAPAPISGLFGRDFSRIPSRTEQTGKTGIPRKKGEPPVRVSGNGGGLTNPVKPADRSYQGPTAVPSPPKLDYTTQTGPDAGDCGEMNWVVQWTIDYKTDTGGWVVQKVELSHNIKTCDDKPFTPGGSNGGFDPSWYPVWEAWQVHKNKAVTTYAEGGDKADDTFGTDGMPDTKGSYTIKGTAEFYDGLSLPSDFKVTNAEPTWILPATKTAPKLTGGTGSKLHSKTASWDCCKDSKSKKTRFS
jgi:hypothetical protein